MSADFDAGFSFNYFESLFNNAKENCVLIIDPDGIIITVNKAFTLCFGYSKNEIIGKHLSVLFTDEDQKKGLPEKEISTVLATGRSSDNNYLVNNNDTITWVSGESVLVKNSKGKQEILKVIQNIHKQKESENELRILNDFNENILRSIDDAVVVLDERLNILKANNSYARLFKRPATEISSLNFADLIKPHDTDHNLFHSIQNVIAIQKGFLNKQIEIDTVSEDKKIFDVNCSSMQDKDNNVLLVMHDITIHKQIEREREDLIGFVAHELRNPLGNIVLCNEIMSEAIKTNNTEELSDMLQRSKNNVTRLNKMIAELYDATRVNAGYMQLEIAAFDFNEMIKEAIETVKILQPAYNIITRGSVSMKVRGDRYRLIQVITNYLSNGIKYSNGNTDVILSVEQNKDSITVSVKDEGLGISKAQLPHVFGRFFRAEKTKSIEGIGLGLYLCRQIITAHRGRVWAESEEGKGSSFYFSIPLDL